MAEHDPVAALKQFLDGLKQQGMRDGRMTHAEHADLRVSAACWYKPLATNWLVYEWQVWASLQGYSRHPQAGNFTEPHAVRPLAAPFVVDHTTALYVGESEGGREWEYTLVWRVGGDFGFRILSAAEVERVSDLNHAMFRSVIGIQFGRLPPSGVPARAA